LSGPYRRNLPAEARYAERVSESPGGADAAARPWPVMVAAGVLLLEALAVLVYAVLEAAHVDPGRPVVAVTTAIFFALFAVGLAVTARGLARLRSWTRGPVVLAELIQLGVAWSFRGPGTTWVTVALAVPAVVVLVIIFSRSTTAALYGGSVTPANRKQRLGRGDRDAG
jgi:hypothetical protein